METLLSPIPSSSSASSSGDDDGVGRISETAKKKKQEERGGLGLALGFAKDFAAGGLAGVTSTVVFQPFDVVKTHIQGSSSTPTPRIAEVVRLILSRSGVRGLWRGTVPACIRVGLGAGLYFTMLGPVLSVLSTGSFVQGSSAGSAESLKSKLPVHVTLAAGAITRSIAASVVCPITVIKTRMEGFTVRSSVRPALFQHS